MQMKVVLRSSRLRAFVVAPMKLKVIGAVYIGQEYGLLATNSEGVYLRVNGSQSVNLDQREVQRALFAAREVCRLKEGHVPKASSPKVIIRRSRRVVHVTSVQ